MLGHLLAVAHPAVGDEAGDALGRGRQGRKPAEGRNAVPAVVDDEDVSRPRGVDDLADLEVVGGEVSAPAGDLPHGDGTSRAAGAGHHLRQARHHALEGDVVEGVGDGRRRQPTELLHNVIGNGHNGRHRNILSILR